MPVVQEHDQMMSSIFLTNELCLPQCASSQLDPRYDGRFQHLRPYPSAWGPAATVAAGYDASSATAAAIEVVAMVPVARAAAAC